MKTLKLKIGSGTDCVYKIEKFIESFIDEFNIENKYFGKISVPVIEAVKNAAVFGNGNDESKYVFIEAILEKEKLSVSVQDDGSGFDYTSVPDPTLKDSPDNAGRGVYLMRALSDDIVFENNGSRITLVFFV